MSTVPPCASQWIPSLIRLFEIVTDCPPRQISRVWILFSVNLADSLASHDCVISLFVTVAVPPAESDVMVFSVTVDDPPTESLLNVFFVIVSEVAVSR